MCHRAAASNVEWSYRADLEQNSHSSSVDSSFFYVGLRGLMLQMSAHASTETRDVVGEHSALVRPCARSFAHISLTLSRLRRSANSTKKTVGQSHISSINYV